jgi:hypothetical protein
VLIVHSSSLPMRHESAANRTDCIRRKCLRESDDDYERPVHKDDHMHDDNAGVHSQRGKLITEIGDVMAKVCEKFTSKHDV